MAFPSMNHTSENDRFLVELIKKIQMEFLQVEVKTQMLPIYMKVSFIVST